jgi:hypothetical protein
LNESIFDLEEKYEGCFQSTLSKHFSKFKIFLFALSLILILINEILDTLLKIETSFYKKTFIDGRLSLILIASGMGVYFLESISKK